MMGPNRHLPLLQFRESRDKVAACRGDQYLERDRQEWVRYKKRDTYNKETKDDHVRDPNGKSAWYG